MTIESKTAPKRWSIIGLGWAVLVGIAVRTHVSLSWDPGDWLSALVVFGCLARAWWLQVTQEGDHTISGANYAALWALAGLLAAFIGLQTHDTQTLWTCVNLRTPAHSCHTIVQDFFERGYDAPDNR